MVEKGVKIEMCSIERVNKPVEEVCVRVKDNDAEVSQVTEGSHCRSFHYRFHCY